MNKNRTLVLAIISAAIAVMLSSGIRQSFGLLLQPIGESLGTGRTVFSFAIALSSIIYGLPLVGIIADKVGPRWVLMAGGVIYTIGLFLMPRITTANGLYLTLGVMIGVALSATTYVVVLGAVGQLVAPERRSSVFGIITAAGSSGMFVVPPAVQLLLDNFGWQQAMLILSAVPLIIILLALGLPNRSNPDGVSGDEIEEPFVAVLRKAGINKNYWLLITGFFVCGFHVTFIATHLPAFLTDNGLAPFVGAGALSMIGGFNMAGSVVFGWLGDRFRKKYLLSFIYLMRAVVIALFIMLPITSTSALVFGGAMGLLWLSTVPLTSGAVAQIFGVRYLSTLYGIVFFSHQVGSFLGVWLGGWLYDTTGTYDVVWYLSIVLGVVASLVHLPMVEQPVRKVQPAGSS
ncbi:MAG: MFS transporter [Chloroflexota bacterium]